MRVALYSCSSSRYFIIINIIIMCLITTLLRGAKCTLANASIPDMATHFGTKCRYEEVNPHLIDDILSVNKSLVAPPSPDCRAVHSVSVIRHGTRFPTAKNIRRIARLYGLVVREASSSEPWVRELRDGWKMWYTEDMDGKLAEKGRYDLRNLAVRLAMSFPSLVTEANLRGGRFEFITSSKHRCVESIRAFQEGLHDYWDVRDLDFSHYVNDTLMRYFDECQRFVEDVEHNETALKEVELFESSEEMDEVRRRMASRLQLPYSHITPDLAEAAFFLCSYEFAIKSENSLWCNLLNMSDAQVMEYKNDLKQYWKRGYGYDINLKASCPLFHDIFSRLEQAAHDYRLGEMKKAVTIQVGHAETLLPLLSLLGFFKDKTPLTAENFSSQHNRKFYTSQIVPYAANLQFVLYDCKDGLRLQFFLNEKPVPVPVLGHTAPLYQTVREHYSDLLGGCDFDTECKLSKGNVKNAEL